MRDLLGKYGCDRNATLLVSKCIRTYSSDDYQLRAFMIMCDVCMRECELVIVHVRMYILFCMISLYYTCFNLHLCIQVPNILKCTHHVVCQTM